MVHFGVDRDPPPYVKRLCTYYYRTYDIEGDIRERCQGAHAEGRCGFVVYRSTEPEQRRG